VPDPNVPVEDLVGVIKGVRRSSRSSAADRALGRDYGGHVLDLSRIDLEEIATALADQTDYEHW
jgi:hypothetical protein